MIRYISFNDNFYVLQEIFSILCKRWYLIIEMTKRDLIEQHKGQILGTAWSIIHPIFLMALYVFIFGFVFKTRIGGTIEMPMNYTVYILSGLIPWLGVQQVLIKSCICITNQAALVKQVVFPLEILPIKTVLSVLMTMTINIIVLTLYIVLQYKTLPATYLLLPFIIMFQIITMIGIAFILSSVAVFLKDLKDVVSVLISIGVYLLPIIYLPGWVPNVFRPILYLNFFSYMTWCYQDIFYFGRVQHVYAWIAFPLGSILLFIFGYRFFRKLRPTFGNYL